jgi:6-phosphogluconolactonase
VAELKVLRTPAPVLEAGRLLRQRMEDIHARNGRVRLAIPGGSALAVLGEARKGLAPEVWKSLCLTWVDERCVPFSSPDSNRGEAHRQGILGDVPIALELPLYLDRECPTEACARVEAVLASEFQGLDLLLLGMGEDGHIASLFPGRPWLSAPARVQIEDQSPKPPARRISLTLSMLASAPEAILMATGEPKRQALLRMLLGDASLPTLGLNMVQIVTELN